jgi:Icc-related predicted phosphoesterase
MRIQVFSDLHVDVAAARPITVDANVDAVVVAGDTCQGAQESFAHVRRIVPMSIPVVMILGNHEYYGRCLPEELAIARAKAPAYGIHLLENDTALIGDVRFVGCTLWTDYRIFDSANVPAAMRAAAQGLNDHRRITWSKRPWARFRPAQALLLHSGSRKFLQTVMQAKHQGATVVITHHAPHPRSLHPRYEKDLLSAAYVSDLEDLILAAAPKLWLHGHVHASFDYAVGKTRVLCNPHGYGNENPDFNPGLVVEVGA